MLSPASRELETDIRARQGTGEAAAVLRSANSANARQIAELTAVANATVAAATRDLAEVASGGAQAAARRAS